MHYQQREAVNTTHHNDDNYSRYQASVGPYLQKKEKNGHKLERDMDNNPAWMAKCGKKTFPSDKPTKLP